MDEDLRMFLQMLDGEPPVDRLDLPAWAGDVALGFVNEHNVADILRILGGSKSNHANLTFWTQVNSAPDTEAGWEALAFFGGDLSEESGDKWKTHFRRSVEAVRAHLGTGQLQRNALFKPSGRKD